jgi:hypothetical protein
MEGEHPCTILSIRSLTLRCLLPSPNIMRQYTFNNSNERQNAHPHGSNTKDKKLQDDTITEVTEPIQYIIRQ